METQPHVREDCGSGQLTLIRQDVRHACNVRIYDLLGRIGGQITCASQPQHIFLVLTQGVKCHRACLNIARVSAQLQHVMVLGIKI